MVPGTALEAVPGIHMRIYALIRLENTEAVVL